jgi:hypothetical protein
MLGISSGDLSSESLTVELHGCNSHILSANLGIGCKYEARSGEQVLLSFLMSDCCLLQVWRIRWGRRIRTRLVFQETRYVCPFCAKIEESLETFYESQIHVHVYLCMVFVDVSYNIKYYIAHLEITLRVNYFSNLFWRYLFCEGLRCWFT